MNVFTLYSEQHCRHLRLWMRSWQDQGFTPRLISLRELEDKTIKQVMKRRGGGVLVRMGAFNLSHKRGKPRAKAHGTRGWQKASVVLFPHNVDESVILECLQAR